MINPSLICKNYNMFFFNCLPNLQLLTAHSRIPLLLLNLLMLTEHHQEVLQIFQEHRSSLIRQRNIVLLVTVALYKTGTPEALKQVCRRRCCGSETKLDPDPFSEYGSQLTNNLHYVLAVLKFIYIF